MFATSILRVLSALPVVPEEQGLRRGALWPSFARISAAPLESRLKHHLGKSVGSRWLCGGVVISGPRTDRKTIQEFAPGTPLPLRHLKTVERPTQALCQHRLAPHCFRQVVLGLG